MQTVCLSVEDGYI